MEKQEIDFQDFEICNSNIEYQREVMLSLVAACCQSDANLRDCNLGIEIIYVREGIYFW
ncbi:hypothetical protein HCA55_17045 [Listeria booriae]|uniref:Uncharacterized protein n=1 Tax=Listeria booriae TaxID=1552123 RepID=A0A842B7F6_9LIST|nr:hypothetical protein [Listeria booriae]